MNKSTRMFAMAGLAVAAGLTLGAGPASAAPAKPSTGGTAAPSSDHRFQTDRTIGFFRNAGLCYRAGKVGEVRNRWDSYTCSPVRRGLHRNTWQLTAKWDLRGHGHQGPQHGQQTPQHGQQTPQHPQGPQHHGH